MSYEKRSRQTFSTAPIQDENGMYTMGHTYAGVKKGTKIKPIENRAISDSIMISNRGRIVYIPINLLETAQDRFNSKRENNHQRRERDTEEEYEE